MKKKKLLDSFAVLAYLKKEKGHEKVKRLLLSDDVALIMNDINIGETYYILARERGLQMAEYFINVIFPSLHVTSLTNSLNEVLEAAKIKSRHSMSYADCFAAATAIREKAIIVTGDPEFKQLGKEVEIEWI
ncbi:MAG TPA: type II toxin-antitoxin system VapC family toxin [Nitrospirae bacterium]|nr:type II toxin-antitoxin system VapC family toxin [Nitrospirota bacterium]HDZ02755.1 type II toxin-antitoxin system VapC family toxin [Nitrospirota bacterium]